MRRRGGLDRRGTSRKDESGNAVVEFVALAVVLLVPLVYLVLLVARVQAASYAVTVAAREAGRVFVTTPPEVDPMVRADTAARLSFEDQGFGAAGSVHVDCAARLCLTPDAVVTVRAQVWVPLPLVPDVLADAVPIGVPVEASYTTTVERFGPS